MIIKVLVGALIALALLAAAIWLIGSRLPMRHRAISFIDLQAAPETVYDRVSDVARAGEWRKDVSSVEMLRGPRGEPEFRLVDGNGAIRYRIEEATRPQRFVTRIMDTDLGFGGTWTITLEPTAAGTRVRIAEDVEVSSPLFRFFSRFVFGHYRTQQAYLSALAASFGEAAVVRRQTQ
jgi:hypothetical protein